ncbi:MAG: NeuD/PglB/VioB family sugar acetyltransferase [Vampirovibrionia bacterium]
MKDVIIFPFGGNAKEAVSVINAINKVTPEYNIIGFLDDNKALKDAEFAGYKVLGGHNLLENYPDAFVLAVPGSPDNYLSRDRVINLLNIDKSRFITAIHPSVIIGEEVNIGFNTLVMPGVVITADVNIGNHCVILPNTVISHDSTVNDYCMIGSNVSISGSVNINKKSYIGTGSKIINNIDIAENTLVGIGSVVIRPTSIGDVVAGSPAKVLRKQPLE